MNTVHSRHVLKSIYLALELLSKIGIALAPVFSHKNIFINQLYIECIPAQG
jgi:hypothetical protein